MPALPGLEGGGDPHVWLDPTLVASLSDRLAAAFAEADPAGAAGFTDRAEALRIELESLDREFRDGLADRAGRGC